MTGPDHVAHHLLRTSSYQVYGFLEAWYHLYKSLIEHFLPTSAYTLLATRHLSLALLCPSQAGASLPSLGYKVVMQIISSARSSSSRPGSGSSSL